MSNLKRPVLRYHGGKWKIGDWVKQFFPVHKTYVEPFCGAASVLMQKDRVLCEVINDLDGRIVNLFRVLQDKNQAEELRRRCFLTPFSRGEFDLAYEDTDDPIEQARRLIILSFFGYGSKSCITKNKNGFRSRRKNSASPAVDWSRWPDHIPAFVERLRGVVVENKPAIDIVRAYDLENGLIYCDPPYVHNTRTLLNGSYHFEMVDKDHRELAAALRECKGYVVVSGYPSELYDEIFKDWPQFSRKAYADQSAERTEVVWLSPRTAEALERERDARVLPLLGVGNG